MLIGRELPRDLRTRERSSHGDLNGAHCVKTLQRGVQLIDSRRVGFRQPIVPD
jgi:hypothetical protein